MDAARRNVFEGHLVRLRGVEPGDWETFYVWNADTEAARASYSIPFPVSREWQEEFEVRHHPERESRH